MLTHRDLPVPAGADVWLRHADVRDVHAEMTTAADGGVVWVMGGGGVAQQFAEAGLRDEVWLQYAPMLIGAGHPHITGGSTPRPSTSPATATICAGATGCGARPRDPRAALTGWRQTLSNRRNVASRYQRWCARSHGEDSTSSRSATPRK